MSDTAYDHFQLEDTRVTRRYFDKFEAIIGHLGRVAATLEAEDRLSKRDVEVMTRYIVSLNYTFKALAHKYHFSGRFAHAGKLTFDRVDSGFPVHNELLAMASDAAQADRHLQGMQSVQALKQDMVRVILNEQEIPTKLQYALSQRLYYEELSKGELFWPRNDPQAIWLGNQKKMHRDFMIHWAVYDSQINLPTIYMMELEDTGRIGLPKDDSRWPEVQAHLMAQALGGLKLLTIAKGFDEDFDDLHPKFMRRIHVGPMYSRAFTLQTGPLRDILAEAAGVAGLDWALSWTTETLLSQETRTEKSGWFSTVEREVFRLDKDNLDDDAPGATRVEHALILPQRAYQVLRHRNPPGLRRVKRYVVGENGRVLTGM